MSGNFLLSLAQKKKYAIK